jgi:chromate reductase
MNPKKIAVLIGSLRKDSWNRKVAKAVMALAPSSLAMEIVEIDQLPLYNQDLDNNPPSTWVAFRERIKSFDGLLFFTPEYNRSISAVLKNAIDVGSRPYGHSVWTGKPGAVVSVSVGALGGFGANQHLRQTFVFLDIPCMQQPEAYIGNAASLFDSNGNLINENSKEFLQKFANAFARWVELHLKD